MLLIGRERETGRIGKIPGPTPSKSGNPGKIGKVPKRTKKEGRVQIGKPSRLKHPRLAALDSWQHFHEISTNPIKLGISCNKGLWLCIQRGEAQQNKNNKRYLFYKDLKGFLESLRSLAEMHARAPKRRTFRIHFERKVAICAKSWGPSGPKRSLKDRAY